jgi:putative ATP-dependent endonuclease of the OLD family
MHVARLKIADFRGVRSADIALSRHVALVVPSNSGETTLIGATQQVGRDRLVRRVTEHEFDGSASDETARIPGCAMTGFAPNGPRDHPNWFSLERGIENLSDPKAKTLIERQCPARSQRTAFPKTIEG